MGRENTGPSSEIELPEELLSSLSIADEVTRDWLWLANVMDIKGVPVEKKDGSPMTWRDRAAYLLVLMAREGATTALLKRERNVK